MEFIRKNGKKKIVEKLKRKWGINSLPYLLIKNNNINGYTGSLSKREIKILNSKINIRNIGLRLLEKNLPSFDSLPLLNPKKNIINIGNKRMKKWLKGRNIKVNQKDGEYILENGGDFLGVGKVKNEKMKNNVPKIRRIE